VMKTLTLAALALTGLVSSLGAGAAPQDGNEFIDDRVIAGASQQPIATDDRVIVRSGGVTKVVPGSDLGIESVPGGEAFALIGLGRGESPRVDVDLRDASVREAAKELADRSKSVIHVEEDVPGDPRVSIKAKNVRLETALDLVTESAGVGWRVESRMVSSEASGGAGGDRRVSQTDKRTYRIGKGYGRGGGFSLNPTMLRQFGIEGAGPNARFFGQGVPYWFNGREERSTFTCPHCKATNTVSRVRQQPKCTKCTRIFQNDWQFCPADGAKRPAGPSDWKFCPSCGKGVQPPKPDAGGPDTGGGSGGFGGGSGFGGGGFGGGGF
jgi:hypothetical protein